MNRRKFIYNSSLASLSVVGLNSCNLLNEDVKLTILHTNDVHSQIEPFPLNHNKYPDRGGFARRANIFKYLMKINPNGFREYDARWLYEKDVDLEGITELGKGLGTQVITHTKKTNPRIIVSKVVVPNYL